MNQVKNQNQHTTWALSQSVFLISVREHAQFRNVRVAQTKVEQLKIWSQPSLFRVNFFVSKRSRYRASFRGCLMRFFV